MLRKTWRSGSRPIAVLAAAVTGALFLASCSGSDGSSDATSRNLDTDPSSVHGSITFSTWWGYADEDIIDGFKAEYPDVDVKLQFTPIDTYPTKIQSQAAAGDLPDVFGAQAATLSGLVDAGKLLDLSDALDTAPADGHSATWGKSFVPSLLSGANGGLDRPNDEMWGVPFNAISVAVVYNKDAYASADVEPPRTFDELLSNCRALRSAGYIPLSLTGKVWAAFWTSFAWDQTLRDADVKDFSVNSPGFVKGYELIKEMADAGCWDKSQISTDIDEESSLFLQQKTASFLTVPENFLKTVADGASFDLGAFQVPAMDGQTPNRTLGGGNANVIVVSKDSDNPAAAVAFAKYLTSSEVQAKLAKEQYTIPSIDLAVSFDDELMKTYTDAAAEGFVDLNTILPPFTTEGVGTLQNEILPSLILGDLTPKQAAQQSADIFQK